MTILGPGKTCTAFWMDDKYVLSDMGEAVYANIHRRETCLTYSTDDACVSKCMFQ